MGRRIRGALVVVLLAGLTGCLWPAPGAGPDRRAHNPLEEKITLETVASLAEAWEASAGGGAVGHPVTSDHGVHVAVSGSMYGFDRKTGSELWTYRHPDLPDFATMGPPVFADGVLWAGHGIGNLGGNYVTQFLDPATGDVVGSLDGAAGVVDGVRGDRYALRSVGFGSGGPVGLSITIGDLEDPDANWSGPIDVTDFSSSTGWTPLTLGEGNVYQAGQGLLIEGEELIRGNGVRSYAGVDQPACPPPIPDYVGCPTWITPLDGEIARSPVLTSDATTLFTATNAGTVYAVDTATGDVVWSTSAGSDVPAEPALADGSLFVPTADGQLVVLDAASGTVLWEAPAGDQLTVQPAVAGGVVYTGAQDGSVSAFDATGCDAETCEPVWSASAGARISGAPAVNDGRLYVGTGDGRLVAYGLP